MTPAERISRHRRGEYPAGHEAARRSLVSRFSMEETISDEALGFVHDIVLRGRGATPFGL